MTVVFLLILHKNGIKAASDKIVIISRIIITATKSWSDFRDKKKTEI